MSILPNNPNKGVNYVDQELKDIWLAGGCFWGVQAYMARVPGVAKTTVGYADGKTAHPSYEDVLYRRTGHAETVHVRYDPNRVSLEELLQQFFSIIDPTVKNRQGNDVGAQYRTGVYYGDGSDLEVINRVVRSERQKHERATAM